MKQAPVISFENVSKKYFLVEDKTFKEVIPSLLRGQSWAHQKIVFDNLTFSINKGETVGVIGRNGAGKSTIMKLIAGVTYPTTGEVRVTERVAPLIELGAGFHHELSGYENIYLNAAILGLHKQETEDNVEKIIKFSELEEYIQVPLKRYSTGMQMRLAFAIAVHTNAPILLIDEVLAVGDIDFQKKCLKKLNALKSSQDITTIFISHDQEAVERFCERAIVLESGKITYDGKPEAAFRYYNNHNQEASE